MNRTVFALTILATNGFLAAQPQAPRPWDDYQVIMWVSGKTVAEAGKGPLVVQRLKEMGVTAGMVTGEGDASMWTKAGMPYYVENIVRTGLCLKFRSPVTDWSKFVNQWMETREEGAFVRPYCLEDPVWLAESKKQMQRAAGMHKANAPLLYDIRDELSVTSSANPFDYDFSPQSLAGFRKWLQAEYGTLEALNKQWDTDFPSWEAVRPFSTDQIKRRMLTGERMPKGPPEDWSALKRVKFDAEQAAKEPVKWNFSPWCDFRSYMDTVLARTLDELRQSARKVDPATPVGIEGTQMPHAFGGYDLWKLSQSLDWVEPYDVCNAREILGDFMPGKALVCTLFEKDAEHAMRRLWHLLLLGDKGCIVWWSEDCIDASKPDYPLTEKGRALAPVFKEMQSPLAKLFMKAERETDPIAIHYSQASIQVAWLLESVADGRTWPRRFSSHESGHNRHAAVRNGWLKLLQDLGYTPRFVSSEQIERGALEKEGIRVLVLPESFSVGESEGDAMKRWHENREGGALVALSKSAAGFDEHGRLRSAGAKSMTGPSFELGAYDQRIREVGGVQQTDTVPRLNGLRATTSGESPEIITQYFLNRGRSNVAAEVGGRLAERLAKNLAFIAQEIRVDPAACVRTHRYRLGDSARLVAFERGVDFHMSEDLKQAGGNEALEKPIQFSAKLLGRAHVYDLRSRAYLGETDEIVVALDPWKPSLYALLPEKLPDVNSVVDHLLWEATGKVK